MCTAGNVSQNLVIARLSEPRLVCGPLEPWQIIFHHPSPDRLRAVIQNHSILQYMEACLKNSTAALAD